jgi:hypothetical protein
MLSYYILMIFNKNIRQTGAAGAYDNVQEGAGRGHFRAAWSSVLHDLRSRAWLGGSQAGGELGQK